MKWYNFWKDVHLTILLGNEFYFFIQYLKVCDFELFAHELLIFIYICYVEKAMEKRSKDCFIHIVIILIFETVAVADLIVYSGKLSTSNLVLSFVFNFIMLLFIWFFPNYIYFRKRKNIFIN
jgi:hypothetical protein|nr:MAG TPA: hypothetical protein [Caudoviricetes sp.]